jgi:DNA-binding transcriptional LysR family regulator
MHNMAAPVDDLNWDDLRYFLRAAQAKTLAGAARTMRVEHTTIGRRLTSLERALGEPLFFRGPEGLRLTPLGEKLAEPVEELGRAVVALRNLVASHRARVRLAVPSGFARLFTARLAKLAKESPALSLELMSGSHPVDLKRGDADLAIRIGPITDKDLVVRRIGESGWSLYASNGYLARHCGTVDPDNLAGHEVIGYDPSLAAAPAAKWIEAHAADATIVLRSREMTDMVSAAASGAGIAALPCILADDEPTLKRLTPEVIATRNVSLVYRREAKASANLRAVIGFVTTLASEYADRIRGRQTPDRERRRG